MSGSQQKQVEDIENAVGNLSVRSDTGLRSNPKCARTSDSEPTPVSKRDKKRVPQHLDKALKPLRGILVKTARYKTHIEFLSILDNHASNLKLPWHLWKVR